MTPFRRTRTCRRGLRVRSLASVLRQDPDALPGVSADESLPDNGFLALNAAFFRDGYLVDLDTGLEADSVLEFLFVSAGKGKAGQARNILRLGPNARVKVVERHVSLDGLERPGEHQHPCDTGSRGLAGLPPGGNHGQGDQYDQ